MDKALRRSALLAIGLMLVLMVNVTYVQGFKAQSLRDNPLNNRQFQDQYAQDRGSILAGGERIAYSRRSGTSGGRAQYQRVYPDGEVFAPVTGYFGPFTRTGLERAENSMLNGSDARLKIHDLFDTIAGKRPAGATVRSTIVPGAQRAAFQALRDSTTLRAAAVALDIKTGAILVLASYPSFDPNDLATHDVDAASKATERLQKDTFRKPLLNKAADELFPPGSSFKSVVASAALGEGMTPGSTVRAGSSYTPPGTAKAIHNSEDSGPCNEATTTLLNAYAQSCNTTFAYLGAQKLGNGTVGDEAARFGFGTAIEYAPDLTAAVSRFPDTDTPGTALASIGQGDTRATPLQMAMVASAAANGGELMKPHLVAKVTAGGSTLAETDAERMGSPLTADESAQLREMMVAVVQKGTATGLKGEDIAGKTGTADVDGASYNERWFTGFSPVADPKYAVAVLTEGPGFGASAAGPIVAEIVKALGG